MYGAVCGDILGSYYEVHCTKDYDCELFRQEQHFTDDTVLTAAVCAAILHNPSPIVRWGLSKRAKEYALQYRAYYARYPHAGFGEMFSHWAKSDSLRRQRSFANGAAMRAVPIGYAYDTMEQVLRQAHASALYTHNHPDAIRAAKAVAASVFLARNGHSKADIRQFLETKFCYDLHVNAQLLQNHFVFDSDSLYSVPPALQMFLESSGYEDAIRRVIALGGDADTMACIAGGIAEAFYGGVPESILRFCIPRIDRSLRDTFDRFCDCYTKS